MKYIHAYKWCESVENLPSIVTSHLINAPEIFHKIQEDQILLTEGADFGLHYENDHYVIRTSNHIHTTFKEIPKNIRQWYSTNMCVKDDVCNALPFGIIDSSQELIEDALQIPKTSNNLLLCNFSVNTAPHKRLVPAKQLIANGFDYSQPPAGTSWEVFVEATRLFHRNIRNSVFVACPEGHGVDSYRIWETFYLGAIPIVTKNHMTENLAARGLPLLLVDSFAEVTQDFLEKQIGKYDNRDHSLLNRDFWIKEIILR